MVLRAVTMRKPAQVGHVEVTLSILLCDTHLKMRTSYAYFSPFDIYFVILSFT